MIGSGNCINPTICLYCSYRASADFANWQLLFMDCVQSCFYFYFIPAVACVWNTCTLVSLLLLSAISCSMLNVKGIFSFIWLLTKQYSISMEQNFTSSKQYFDGNVLFKYYSLLFTLNSYLNLFQTVINWHDGVSPQ